MIGLANTFTEIIVLSAIKQAVFWNRNTSPAPAEKKILPDENSDLHKKILELNAGDIEVYEAAKNLVYS